MNKTKKINPFLHAQIILMNKLSKTAIQKYKELDMEYWKRVDEAIKQIDDEMLPTFEQYNQEVEKLNQFGRELYVQAEQELGVNLTKEGLVLDLETGELIKSKG